MAGGLGAALALGSRSTIHAWGRDGVAKVPLPSTPEGWIESEAAFTAAVHRVGAPVPRVLGVELIDGRSVSIYERINGRSMWAHVVDRPSDVPALARTLAELQCHLFTLLAPVEVPRQTDRVVCKVRRASARFDPSLIDALGAIPPIDAHLLCHGDLHPGNVIMSDRGPVLVDWFDVARGEPIADVARSLLLMSFDLHGVAGPGHLPGASEALLNRVRDAYRAAIEDALAPDAELLETWLAVLAVARIAEGVTAAPLQRRWISWRDRGPGERSGAAAVADERP